MSRYGQIRLDLIDMASKNGAILIDPKKHFVLKNIARAWINLALPYIWTQFIYTLAIHDTKQTLLIRR